MEQASNQSSFLSAFLKLDLFLNITHSSDDFCLILNLYYNTDI